MLLMAHLDSTGLISWSMVTAAFMIITCLVYTKISKDKKDESHTP